MNEDIVSNITTDEEFADKFSLMASKICADHIDKACEYVSYVMFNFTYDNSLLDMANTMLSRFNYKEVDIRVTFSLLNVCCNNRSKLRNFDVLVANSKDYYTTKHGVDFVNNVYRNICV